MPPDIAIKPKEPVHKYERPLLEGSTLQCAMPELATWGN
jgi:hypothetical protein